jgi:hypothetical protein
LFLVFIMKTMMPMRTSTPGGHGGMAQRDGTEGWHGGMARRDEDEHTWGARGCGTEGWHRGMARRDGATARTCDVGKTCGKGRSQGMGDGWEGVWRWLEACSLGVYRIE